MIESDPGGEAGLVVASEWAEFVKRNPWVVDDSAFDQKLKTEATQQYDCLSPDSGNRTQDLIKLLDLPEINDDEAPAVRAQRIDDSFAAWFVGETPFRQASAFSLIQILLTREALAETPQPAGQLDIWVSRVQRFSDHSATYQQAVPQMVENLVDDEVAAEFVWRALSGASIQTAWRPLNPEEYAELFTWRSRFTEHPVFDQIEQILENHGQ